MSDIAKKVKEKIVDVKDKAVDVKDKAIGSEHADDKEVKLFTWLAAHCRARISA